ncbi:Zn-dependent oligopeptidase [Horticoccus luteus]|uniref:Zn-dependent oligopeptidase n=1 Tax=Horticoccus luteus TaxID=2862869 RepID=A0A8F9TRZ5_9BACT|nr:M3 family metallopeptidase [Horticoccus luteus]QYM78119.1 Zn-dependent oligopeptidase [Horticoccus luteus]
MKILRWIGFGIGFIGAGAVMTAATKLEDLQAQATRDGMALVLPTWARNAAEVQSMTKAAIARADAALAKLAQQPADAATFASTFAAYDAITGDVAAYAGQNDFVSETSVDVATRDAARAASVTLQQWAIALDYRADVYRVLKAFADRGTKLDAQEQRLVDFTLRDYRRAGLALPAEEQKAVEGLRKELSATEEQFSTNINQARAPIDFTAEELAGVPESFLASPGVKQADGKFRAMLNITFHALALEENATNPETRRRALVARETLAKESNTPVLTKLVQLRAEIAHRLGYGSWADYRTETRMAKTGAAALKFEEDLVTALQPKWSAELETLRQLKVSETKDPAAKLEAWDIRYYLNQLKKERYAVDAEQLRVYFPYQATLEGMFRIYQRIFGLTFTRVEAPYLWTPGVQFFVVSDAKTGVAMGSFYLDMFPREGKFNHFACFPQTPGRVGAEGKYELPVEVLVCNFPPPAGDKPSLLAHDEVVTLFHEFGHVMHGILSRARFQAQTSFGVPQDFVEGPSQMLENWPWDKAVLDTFAADYRDPSKKIPAETIAALTKARVATEGYYNRRQLSFGLIDLRLHLLTPAQAAKVDVVGLSNDVLARVFVAQPEGTSFVTYFGHLVGYDAGYYGYLWSRVMAIDMASVFKQAADGFLDVDTGLRLRKEVYGVGDTRDVGESVEKFLGRPRSMDAFLNYVGLPKKSADAPGAKK